MITLLSNGRLQCCSYNDVSRGGSAEGFIGPLETEKKKKSRVKRWFVQPSAGYRPLISKGGREKKKLLTIARERTCREEARFIGIPARFQAAGIIFQRNAKISFPCRWFIVRSDFPSSWKIANFLRVILWDY